MTTDIQAHIWPTASVIIPPERQREKAEPDAVLLASIEQHGLIQPIVVHADGRLVAGERRLRAHITLARPTIRVTVLEELPPREAFLLELMENIARKNLSWQEECAAIGRYHQMRLDEYPGWTGMGTASDLGISNAQVSRFILVAGALDDENVCNCPTFQGALNYLQSQAERARIAAQSRGLEIAGIAAIIMPPNIPADASKSERTAALLAHMDLKANVAKTVDEIDEAVANVNAGRIAAAALEQQRRTEVVSDIIVNNDFLEWAETYTGPRFDVLHVDFPYGKNYSGARTRKTFKHISPVYQDHPDIYFALLEGLLLLQDNIVFPAAHCIFWFDMSYYQVTIEAFEAAGWDLVQPYPLVWTKGYSGIASDVRRRPRHCYETALFFSRGDRKIVKLEKDHYECSLDPEKLHLNQKPVEMLKHFLSIVVDEHTAVLDPTCGSGSALAAAGQLGAARLFGVELDPNNAEIARYLLQRYHPEIAKATSHVLTTQQAT